MQLFIFFLMFSVCLLVHKAYRKQFFKQNFSLEKLFCCCIHLIFVFCEKLEIGYIAVCWSQRWDPFKENIINKNDHFHARKFFTTFAILLFSSGLFFEAEKNNNVEKNAKKIWNKKIRVQGTEKRNWERFLISFLKYWLLLQFSSMQKKKHLRWWNYAYLNNTRGKLWKTKKLEFRFEKKNAKVALLEWSPGFSIKHKNNCHTDSSNSSWMFVRKHPA